VTKGGPGVNRKEDKYHIFLSYARSDDTHDLARKLADEMRSIFARRTGHDLRVFHDKQVIKTADIWENRIRNALQASSVLVAVVSPEYLRSQWCRREWDYFEAMERVPSPESDIPRIFPVLLNGEDELQRAAPAAGWNLDDITSREYIDLKGGLPGLRKCASQLDRLMDGVVHALDRSDADRTPIDDVDTVYLWAITGYLRDKAHHVALLANAAKVTIVGFTNEGLADLLREALELKRRQPDSDSFWGLIRVVYLDEKLLDSVSNDRAVSPRHDEAVYQRRISAGYSTSFVRSLLQELAPSPNRWDLYRSANQLPFAGALVTPPNQGPIVQLTVARPHRGRPDHLYVEFKDRPDQSFTTAFDEIVNSSIRDIKAVPLGAPEKNGVFHCTAERFRDQVLIDGSQENGWLPVVLAVTWWRRDDSPTLVVQMRTKGNSYRELGHLSHLASYVYLTDVLAAAPGLGNQTAGYDLPDSAPLKAVIRRIEIETGGAPVGELAQVATCRYLYPDKENLFFYIYTLEIPRHFRYFPEAQIQPTTVEDLLAIRERQTLRNVRNLYEQFSISRQILPAAAEIAALNLLLHGHRELHDEIMKFTDSTLAIDQIKEGIASLEQETDYARLRLGRQADVAGLPGLQYREFFSLLLRLYSDIGIPGADEQWAAVQQGDARQQAMERLRKLYFDEDVMGFAPADI
jgi:hypothetical protein